jgi:site-specific recombinase XerD
VDLENSSKRIFLHIICNIIKMSDLEMLDGNEYLHECLHCVSAVRSRVRKRDSTRKTGTTFATRITNSLITMIHPVRLDESPSDETLIILESWRHDNITKHSVELSFHTVLDMLKVHPKILAVFNRRDIQRESVWDDILTKMNMTDGICDARRPYYAFNLIGAIPALLKISENSDPMYSGSWGDISMEDAVDFCITGSNTSCISMCRIHLLEVTGFKHSRMELDRHLQHAVKLRDRYRTMVRNTDHIGRGRSSTCVTRTSFHDYLSLLKRLGFESYDEIQTADADHIREILLGYPTKHKRMFTLVAEELRRFNRNDVIHELQMTLPSEYTGLSLKDRMSGQSTWVKNVIDTAVEYEKRASHGRTSYTDVHTKILSDRICLALEFIRRDTIENNDKSVDMDISPIKWFFDHGDMETISALIIRYAQNRRVRNDLVKSSSEGGHAAAPPVQEMLRFFNGGFLEFLAYKDQIHTLNFKRIIRRVDNKREAADPDTRRTFTSDEIDRMLASTTDPRQLLIITRLREVGLRVSAIGHMKYNMLVDDNNVPRDICTIPEKKNTKRRFVTSFNLKKRIKAYVDYFRMRIPLDVYGDTYIMNPNNCRKPYCASSIRGMLHKISSKAGITGIHVHPHAFRHTIVGTLMKAGNSMEHVSKFMGHAQVDTTSKFYWVATTKELTEQMNNPFMPNYKTEDERKLENNDELQLQCQKTQTCMEIISTYNQIISKCIDEGSAVINVQKLLFQSMPNLGNILESINSSEASSDGTRIHSESDDDSDEDE